ncbi:MAG: MBL fold metallo-hydrolase [Steroidobacteraceae bacterium]|nr:MBL fold metallo-hydrolase [Steroidobacteraceae bacterium]
MPGAVIVAALALSACGKVDGIDVAAKNMNVADTNSIQIIGNGMWGWVGQQYSSTTPWVQIPVSSYALTADYTAGSSHVLMTRTAPTEADDVDKAQNLEFRNEYFDFLRPYLDEYLSGNLAWNVMAPDRIRARPDRVAERLAALQSTPHGFLKLALEHKAPFRKTSNGGETTFMVGNQQFYGRFNAQGDLELVQTWIDYPVLGDMLVETQFEDYKIYDGVRFPSRITGISGGWPILRLNVTSVRANVPASVTVPEEVENYQEPPIRIAPELVAPGVWHMRGGSHNALLIEMADYLVFVEATEAEEHTQAIIAKGKELAPGKPVRYVVSTHPHFDHAGGLRAYMAEGATLVTHAANVGFYQKAWSNPRTLNPDAMSKSNLEPKFLPVKDKISLSDGKRSIDVFAMRNVHHYHDMVMVYLPTEKMIWVTDVYRPSNPANAPLQDFQVKGAAEFVENLERVGIDVAKVVTGHGNRVGTKEELLIDAGRMQPKGAKSK